MFSVTVATVFEGSQIIADQALSCKFRCIDKSSAGNILSTTSRMRRSRNAIITTLQSSGSDAPVLSNSPSVPDLLSGAAVLSSLAYGALVASTVVAKFGAPSGWWPSIRSGLLCWQIKQASHALPPSKNPHPKLSHSHSTSISAPNDLVHSHRIYNSLAPSTSSALINPSLNACQYGIPPSSSFSP